MKIELWSIGKAHDVSIRDAIEDYTGRIKKYAPVKWAILPTPRQAAMMSELDLKKMEGKMVLEWLDKDAVLVVLDERGKEMNSDQLSELIVKRGNMGTKKLVFLIGGAYGIDKAVLERANHTLSLSKLTFPHQLVRLILAEQIYRAYTIINNEKYHHR